MKKFLEKMYSKIGLLFIITLTLYFSLDGILLNVGKDLGYLTIVGWLSVSAGTFFLVYVLPRILNIPVTSTKDIPNDLLQNHKNWGTSKSTRRYVVIGFIVMTVLTFALFFGYYFCISDDSGVKTAYFLSQPAHQVLIAPVMEELMFRYLLYDCWARNKLGKIKGALVVTVIFILFHPIDSIAMFILYWIPVLFLFIFYEQTGLYGSILAHMIYNTLAL